MSTQRKTTPTPAEAAAAVPLKPAEKSALNAFLILNEASREAVFTIAAKFVKEARQASGEAANTATDDLDNADATETAPEWKPSRACFSVLQCIGLAIVSRLASSQLLSYEAIADDLGNLDYAVREVMGGFEDVLPHLDFVELQRLYDKSFNAMREENWAKK